MKKKSYFTNLSSVPAYTVYNIKVAVSRDFLAFFKFDESNPPGPQINRPKWFSEKFVFAKILEF